MEPVKVVILGATGMAGHVISTYLSEFPQKYLVYNVARSNSELIRIDFNWSNNNFDDLKKLLNSHSFKIIINCIGVLNTMAEDNPDEAILINSYLPHFIESYTKSNNSKLIHISTDCVFSGKRGDYKEDDFRDGNGFYAQSKALGEVINDKDLNLRTSIIGPELKNGIGLFHWFMHQKGEIKGYTQTYWSGVTSIELAKIVHAAIEQEIVGLYHISNNNKISKYNLLKTIQTVFRTNDISISPADNFKIDKSLINTRNDFNYQIPDYQQMIDEMKHWMHKHKDIYHYYK